MGPKLQNCGKPSSFRGFHSTDCPSEWGQTVTLNLEKLGVDLVSIQLIAPASGAPRQRHKHWHPRTIACFHSTDCPSEWGPVRYPSQTHHAAARFHSTDCPQRVGPVRHETKYVARRSHPRFHSTDCPSEWGPDNSIWNRDRIGNASVSIQLIAPASGALVIE